MLADSDAEPPAPRREMAKSASLYEKVKQSSTAYDPAEGRRVQELAKKLEGEIEEELK